MPTETREAVETTRIDTYDLEALPWSRAVTQLDGASRKGDVHQSFWLSTVDPDGAPHVAAVGGLWDDGHVYFTSGDGTRKSRNLRRDPRCAISVSLDDLDLVIEGHAEKVTDQPTLQRLAARYDAQGWPAKATDGALTAEYSAPSAGPPPWNLYRIDADVAFGVATAEPHGATRWRFDGQD